MRIDAQLPIVSSVDIGLDVERSTASNMMTDTMRCLVPRAVCWVSLCRMLCRRALAVSLRRSAFRGRHKRDVLGGLPLKCCGRHRKPRWTAIRLEPLMSSINEVLLKSSWPCSIRSLASAGKTCLPQSFCTQDWKQREHIVYDGCRLAYPPGGDLIDRSIAGQLLHGKHDAQLLAPAVEAHACFRLINRARGNSSGSIHPIVRGKGDQGRTKRHRCERPYHHAGWPTALLNRRYNAHAGGIVAGPAHAGRRCCQIR